jgi:ComF family protein
MCEPCSASLEPLEGGHVSPSPLEEIVSPWRFGGQLAIAIRRLKFAGHTYVARSIAPLWAPLVGAATQPDALVVPVPLHWRRRFTRGFDHAWLLALHACAAAGLPRPVPALRRTRAAPPQSTLTAAARLVNLRGAFAACRPVEGRTIVLVDDVATTGATLSECARTLLAAGATRVIGVVLARAEQ